VASELSLSGKGPRSFLDSNVLVYSDDPRDPAKQIAALTLLKEHMRQRTGVISLQVLQEYFVSARGKLRLDAELAKRRVEIFAKFQVVEPRVSDILAAIDVHRLHGFSYWDSLIVHCARQAGCAVLLTEDMQHGQVIDGVRVVNPFL
jgi:predicted nucleic acid-binding protein